MAPRSSATTLRPAFVNSLERMPPVQPRPTTTTSTSLSLVTMLRPPSAHVRDAERIGGERLVEILCDILAIDLDHAREADELPARLVAIAAVDRVGEHPLHHGLIDRGPEHPRRQPALEAHLAGGKANQDLLALLLVQTIERLAVGLGAIGIGRRNAGPIELRRRERKLIALARYPRLPRPLRIEPIALAPGAGERAIDIDVDAHIGALGRELIGGHHVIDQRLDERRLLKIEERIAGCRGRGGLSLRGRGDLEAGGCSRGATDHRALEKITSADIFFCSIVHATLLLPLLPVLP